MDNKISDNEFQYIMKTVDQKRFSQTMKPSFARNQGRSEFVNEIQDDDSFFELDD